MRTTVNSRNLELTDALRGQIDRKLRRLERITHPDADATIELFVHASRAAETSHVAEVSLVNNGSVIRSVGAGATMSAALDNLVDRLERQVVRARERPRSVRDRAEELQSREAPVEGSMPAAEATGRPEVVEIKRYDMTPMFEEVEHGEIRSGAQRRGQERRLVVATLALPGGVHGHRNEG